MSNHTIKKSFLFKKKLEGYLNWLFGNKYIPLYKMVSFTRISFSDIIIRNSKQQQLLNYIIYGVSLFSIISVGVISIKISKHY